MQKILPYHIIISERQSKVHENVAAGYIQYPFQDKSHVFAVFLELMLLMLYTWCVPLSKICMSSVCLSVCHSLTRQRCTLVQKTASQTAPSDCSDSVASTSTRRTRSGQMPTNRRLCRVYGRHIVSPRR